MRLRWSAAACAALFAACGAQGAAPPPQRAPATPPGAAAAGKPLRRPPAPAASNGAVLLRLKYQPGAVRRYHLAILVDARLPGAGSDPDVPVYTLSVDLVEQEHVVKLLPHGGALVEVSTVSGAGTLNGKPFTPPTDSKPQLLQFDAQGDLTAPPRDAKDPGGGLPVLNGFFTAGAVCMHGIFLLDRPVRPGERWTRKMRLGGFSGAGMATVRSLFTGYGTVGPYRTARIHSMVSLPLRTFLTASGGPASARHGAANALTGFVNMTYDSDLAVDTGAVLRTAEHGEVVARIHPLAAQAVKAAQKAAPPGPPLVILLQLGSELQEE